MNYDVVIIGGGINGAGVAQAVSAAGYSCLLIEKKGLAAETSRCSSKLIHGGLRYLESFDIGLVKESLYERSLLLKLAPDLVKLTPFNIPVYKDTSRQAGILSLGLGIYSLLASLSSGQFNRTTRFSRVKVDAWNELEGLSRNGLKHVFRYYDAQTDDAALTQAVMHSAIKLGAELVTPAEVSNIEMSHTGCSVEYIDNNQKKTVDCMTVVNAAGPWVIEVIQKVKLSDNLTVKSLKADLVQGTHLVLKSPVVNECYYLESPSDKRAVFLLPWKGGSLLGTTETLFNGDLNQITALESEKDYLLAVAKHYFPNSDFRIKESLSGLRVLPNTSSNVFKRSRDTVILSDNKIKPRFLSIYGGKLTVFRATAEKVLTELKRTLPLKKAIIKTNTIKLHPVN